MITNQQVFTSMQGVLAEIVRAANEVTDPNPTPPLKGGEWLRKVQAKETTAQVGFLMNKLARPYSVPKALRAEIESLRNNVQVILKDATTSYNVSTAALGVKYGIQGIRWALVAWL